MNIQVNAIEKVSESHFLVRLGLGDEDVKAHITELPDQEVQGFNFDEDFFSVLFAFNGLGSRFSRDYWAYRAGDGKAFPWDYGTHESKILDLAITESGTSIASLR